MAAIEAIDARAGPHLQITVPMAMYLATDILDAAAPLIRKQIADEIEAEDSPLCDCRIPDGSGPVSPRTGQPMPHHCDCAAVALSGVVRKDRTATRHHRECTCRRGGGVTG
jgi:hypothetical protein